MRSICLITLFYITSSVSSEFPSGFKLNHKLLMLNIGQDDVSSIKEKWIEQPLDNFNKLEKRTLKMKYYQNLYLWKPNGPIYLFIKGEEEASPDWIACIDSLLIAQLARDTNGAMFTTEHRYYGSSLPDIPKDDHVKYYKFLSSRQALADIANLIKALKSDEKFQSSPVVVIGGSYAGNLAAWMRELYPDLVDAAVSSSAPLLAKKDFREYLDVVRYTFGKYGTKNCLKHIEDIFKKYEDLLKTPSGRETLKNLLHLNEDDDLTVLENQQDMFISLYDNLENTAQYGPRQAVIDLCKKYESSSKMLTLNVLLYMTLSIRERIGKALDDDGSSEQEDGKAWNYQVCNEFGYFPTTSSEKQPFVHWSPLEYWLKDCKNYIEGDFENKLDEGVARTNVMYGGLTPKVSKVVFTHGDMDPWRVLGVQQDLAPDAPAFVINGTAHCDMLCYSSNEPKDLTEHRKHVKDLIKKWIAR